MNFQKFPLASDFLVYSKKYSDFPVGSRAQYLSFGVPQPIFKYLLKLRSSGELWRILNSAPKINFDI